MNRVENYYDTDPSVEWERLNRHRTEHAVTLCALEEYLPPAPARIIDIGGGPGRYAIDLTTMGYSITLVDLSQQNLNYARIKSREIGVQIDQLVHADAKHLEPIPSHEFEAALLMGPLYHLISETDRRQAIREASRVLVSNGLIFAAFISRYAIFRDGAAKYPLHLFEQKEIHQQIWQQGVNAGSGFTDAYFALPGEIIPLMESEGYESIALLNVEGIVAEHETEVNKLNGDAWDYWVEQNYRFAKDPDLRGCADHLLFVGKKK